MSNRVNLTDVPRRSSQFITQATPLEPVLCSIAYRSSIVSCQKIEINLRPTGHLETVETEVIRDKVRVTQMSRARHCTLSARDCTRGARWCTLMHASARKVHADARY